jgi:hypothetical protein
MDVALPHGPDFFQFGSPERMRLALEEAGFADSTAFSFNQEWNVANADLYMDAILTGTVRAGAVLAAQSADATSAVRSYIAEYLTRFQTPAGGLASTEVVEFQHSPRCRFCGRVAVAIGPDG